MRTAWLALLFWWPLACGDDDLLVEGSERPDPAVDASVVDATVLVDAGVRVDAAAPGVVDEPSGLDAWTPDAFARLCELRLGTRVQHASSADRSGGNADYGVSLGTDAHGDQLLWDRHGAGALRRIWVTGFSPEQRLKMYFDGESTPRVDATLGDFFAGTSSPFLAPLALDDDASSGGFVSSMPFPYATSLTVTVSGAVRYYNIDGHALFGTPSSWSGLEDTGVARALLARAGLDPKPAAETIETAATFDSNPGDARVLVDVDGPRSISALELRLPGVVPLGPDDAARELTEIGRAVAVESSFELAVDPANYGVMLRRLTDYGAADQRVQVAVDGNELGEWSTPGSDTNARFRQVGFFVPESIARGKSRLSLRLRASAGTWNEYRYEAISHTERGRPVTDTLDVGDVASEASHGYTTQGSELVTSTARQPSFAELAARSAGLRLTIAWDGETNPSVDAPVGSLFGVGELGPGLAAGLGTGLRADGTFYLYFPMPFARHARVTLHNVGTQPVPGVQALVRHRAFTSSFDTVGYFSSSYWEGTSTKADDLRFLATEGSGQVVAVVQTVHDTASRGFMQGDERIYVDGARTPVVQGTGTEDFYNGGFYFRRGPFAQATHGEATLVNDASGSGTTMYRQMIGDPIPYRAGIRLGIEHGADNAVPVRAALLALYYRQPHARLIATDTLTLGDAESERAHGYLTEGETWRGTSTFSFEGDADAVAWTAAGCMHRGSRFELAVDPGHVGVTLRRTFDQLTTQRAEIWVDGVRAGEWLTPEHNETHRFREEDFDLPLALTAGRSRLAVEIRVPVTAPAWNEYRVVAFSRTR